MPLLNESYRRGLDRQVAPAFIFETMSSKVIDDNENIVWRRIGSDLREMDMNPAKREQVIRTMEEQFFSSPLARIILVWWVDFILGRGFYLTSSDPAAAEVLREFWSSPVNDMEERSRLFVKELCFYGELAVVVKVNPSNGFCGLSLIPSSQIDDLQERAGFPGEIDKVITRAEEKYQVIAWDPKAGTYEGECFLYRINRLAGHVRGYPDLIPLLDWTHVFEAFSYNKLERDAQQYGVWWDVTLQGKTEEEIKAWQGAMGGESPRPGSAICHNERAIWNLVQQKPSFAAARDAEFFLNFILGTSGIKDFNSNNASGELLDPAINSMNSRQKEVYNFFIKVGKFQIQEAIRAGRLSDENYNVMITSQRIGVRDIQRSSGALTRITSSLAVAVENGWLSSDHAKGVYNELLYRLDLVERPRDKYILSDEERENASQSVY